MDAATNVNDSTGLAFIARDKHGRFLAAKNLIIPVSFNPRTAEAFALKEALSWLYDKQWARVIIETDCQEVFFAVTDRMGVDFTPFGADIKDIQQLQRQFQHYCRWSCVSCLANMAAHELVRATRTSY